MLCVIWVFGMQGRLGVAFFLAFEVNCEDESVTGDDLEAFTT